MWGGFSPPTYIFLYFRFSEVPKFVLFYHMDLYKLPKIWGPISINRMVKHHHYAEGYIFFSGLSQRAPRSELSPCGMKRMETVPSSRPGSSHPVADLFLPGSKCWHYIQAKGCYRCLVGLSLPPLPFPITEMLWVRTLFTLVGPDLLAGLFPLKKWPLRSHFPFFFSFLSLFFF